MNTWKPYAIMIILMSTWRPYTINGAHITSTDNLTLSMWLIRGCDNITLSMRLIQWACDGFTLSMRLVQWQPYATKNAYTKHVMILPCHIELIQLASGNLNKKPLFVYATFGGWQFSTKKGKKHKCLSHGW